MYVTPPPFPGQSSTMPDCGEPTCRYNSTQGQLDNVGYCICQRQFCEEHFSTHACFNQAMNTLNATTAQTRRN